MLYCTHYLVWWSQWRIWGCQGFQSQLYRFLGRNNIWKRDQLEIMCLVEVWLTWKDLTKLSNFCNGMNDGGTVWWMWACDHISLNGQFTLPSVRSWDLNDILLLIAVPLPSTFPPSDEAEPAEDACSASFFLIVSITRVFYYGNREVSTTVRTCSFSPMQHAVHVHKVSVCKPDTPQTPSMQ